jgi:hypothetical protein
MEESGGVEARFSARGPGDHAHRRPARSPARQIVSVCFCHCRLEGVVGLCLASSAGVQKNAARGLQLGKESVNAGSCYGMFTVAYCNDRGYGVAVDKAEAARL